MASEVGICNRALDMLGQPPILALDNSSKTAAACLRNYGPSRDYVLRSYPWNSATARVSLVALTEAPAFGYARAFQLPADCLRVMDTEDDLKDVSWRREGNLLLTDAASPLRIRYIRRLTDPSLMDDMLAEVIAAHVASSIAYQIVGSNEAVARAATLYREKHADARMLDAREQSQDEGFSIDTWLNARF
ncbi:MAG: hypothetical protein K2X74_00485 [Acetobacteraceae bacterium]|nr:hypothetical protein [Acetobacteraceae bacterium]